MDRKNSNSLIIAMTVVLVAAVVLGVFCRIKVNTQASARGSLMSLWKNDSSDNIKTNTDSIKLFYR